MILEQKEIDSFLKTGDDLKVKGMGAKAGRGEKELVTSRAQEKEPAKVSPQLPLEEAMVKTETGSMGAGDQEGTDVAQNIPDDENNSQEHIHEEMDDSGQQEEGEPVFVNPTSDQRNEVFGHYMKAMLKEGKSAWKCLVCGVEMSMKTIMRRHVEAVHNDIVHQVFQHKCRYCSKVLSVNLDAMNQDFTSTVMCEGVR